MTGEEIPQVIIWKHNPAKCHVRWIVFQPVGPVGQIVPRVVTGHRNVHEVLKNLHNMVVRSVVL
jgi:hypothetical protein